MKYCCFRFDADTHACVARGIPALSALGDQLGVRFTFFVNMGRAFSRRITAAKALRRLGRRRQGSISAAGKLGWRDALIAAALNPRAGRAHPGPILAAARAGHEIGLHGGRNHATWERSASEWSEDRVRGEIETALGWLAEIGVERVNSFASPAWNSPAALRAVLPGLGFDVLADVYDATRADVSQDGALISVPTNITAEPGSAGYLETMRLRGWSTGQIVEKFRRQLDGQERLAVVYDHPFFAGVHALDTVGELARAAVNAGFQVCTVSEAAHALSGQPVP